VDNSLVITIPKITNEILLPISIVAKKSDSFFVKYAIIFDGNLPELLSSSNWSLFAEINAISTPEKKAENISVIHARAISIS